MTKELFLQDHYMKNCSAMVTEVIDDKNVVLDQTVFYPQGGGQPSDIGELTNYNGDLYKVVSVKKIDGRIVHELDREGVKKCDMIECSIDWERRYKLMRFHTSAHILSRVLFLETGSLITGNQLDVELSRMDFSSTSFNSDSAKMFEEKTNQVISLNFDVNIFFEKFETAMQRPHLFRLKNALPKNLEMLRIVSIGDFDVQADGGTHVKNTSEIGKVKILKTENKGKENKRLYWTLDNAKY